MVRRNMELELEAVKALQEGLTVLLLFQSFFCLVIICEKSNWSECFTPTNINSELTSALFLILKGISTR